MKTNIKTFPTPDLETESKDSINRMYIAWKVAFKKELQEMRKSKLSRRPTKRHHTAEWWDIEGFITVIGEILGDEV